MRGFNKTIIKLNKEKNKGTTIVELVVTFALLGIFMVAAMRVIFSTMDTYYQVRSESYGIQISSMLADKIRGELENALVTVQKSDFLQGADGKNLSGGVMLAKDGSFIEFTNTNGSHVVLKLDKLKSRVGEDGTIMEAETDELYLTEYFYAVNSIDTDDDGNDIIIEEYKAVDWQFALDMYMGYSVQSLNFEQLEDNKNIIRVDITISSPRYGSYTTTEYVALYNYKNIYSASTAEDKTGYIVSGEILNGY